MDANDKIAVVHRYVEAFDKGDLEIIREMYADDAIVEDPVGADPYVGIDAILEFYRSGLAAGVKLELTGEPRCAGMSVAFPFKVVMEGMNISPIDVFDFNEDGKVKHMRAYWG